MHMQHAPPAVDKLFVRSGLCPLSQLSRQKQCVMDPSNGNNLLKSTSNKVIGGKLWFLHSLERFGEMQLQ